MKFKQYVNKLVKATINSLDGIKTAWKTQLPFRQEIYVSIVALPVIYFLAIPSVLKLMLVMLLLLMLLVEIINSAIENAIDRISRDKNPLSKNAKDMGSAAVAIVILMNVIAWVYVIFLIR